MWNGEGEETVGQGLRLFLFPRKDIPEMIADLRLLRDLLGSLDPEDADFDLRADDLVIDLDPELGAAVCQPFFEYFEAHPLSYAGAPGAFVHHIETFYPEYIPELVRSVERQPSVNAILMINRILNSPECAPARRNELLQLLRGVTERPSCEGELVELASRYVLRHSAE